MSTQRLDTLTVSVSEVSFRGYCGKTKRVTIHENKRRMCKGILNISRQIGYRGVVMTRENQLEELEAGYLYTERVQRSALNKKQRENVEMNGSIY